MALNPKSKLKALTEAQEQLPAKWLEVDRLKEVVARTNDVQAAENPPR